MVEPYCGTGKIPKGKRRGSVKECLDRGEVRYYGIKQIDPRLLEAHKEKKYDMEKTDDLLVRYASMKGKLKNMIEKIKKEENPDRKDKMKISAKKLLEETKMISNKIAKAQKKNKKTEEKPKKSSKKSSSKSKSRSKKQKGGSDMVIIGSRELRKSSRRNKKN